jgi:CHAT domain-containing protein
LLAVVNPTGDLENATDEVTAIASTFPQHSSRLLLGAEATPTKLCAEAANRTYLHFACHAAFNWLDPQNSGLVLAGGVPFTIRDIDAKLSLEGVRLITASACETGVTEFERTPNEFVGLPAALMQAGVPGVISTLWPVDDLSTALLMARFYYYHLRCGLDPATALGRAQRWLRTGTSRQLGLAEWYTTQFRRTGDPHAFQAMGYYQTHSAARPFVHPFFWASFIAVGA